MKLARHAPRRIRLFLSVMLALTATVVLMWAVAARDLPEPRRTGPSHASSPPALAAVSYAPPPGATIAPSNRETARVPTAPPATVDGRADDPQIHRDRYGVNLSGADPAQIARLGLRWFIPCCAPEVEPPPGTRVVQRIFFARDGRDLATIQARVRRHPGSYWLVDNEPNVPEMGNTSPSAYADALAWYAQAIKSADPTAMLVGPNVLNWEQTCDGCTGFTRARDWTEQFRAAYRTQHGTEPPLDVWSLHTYDLDWSSLPQGNALGQIAQIQGMRRWLDSFPSLRDAPIWVTEIGIAWGYPALAWQDGRAVPAGAFDLDHVARYLRDLFGWLDANAAPLHIDRWFLWSMWEGAESWQTQPGGIALVEGPAADAPITRLGRLYQELAAGP